MLNSLAFSDQRAGHDRVMSVATSVHLCRGASAGSVATVTTRCNVEPHYMYTRAPHSTAVFGQHALLIELGVVYEAILQSPKCAYKWHCDHGGSHTLLTESLGTVCSAATDSIRTHQSNGARAYFPQVYCAYKLCRRPFATMYTRLGSHKGCACSDHEAWPTCRFDFSFSTSPFQNSWECRI